MASVAQNLFGRFLMTPPPQGGECATDRPTCSSGSSLSTLVQQNSCPTLYIGISTLGVWLQPQPNGQTNSYH